MMVHQVGDAAGVVWRYLDEKGPASASRIKKDVPLPPGMVERAIGWLAREEKVDEVKKGRSTELKAI